MPMFWPANTPAQVDFAPSDADTAALRDGDGAIMEGVFDLAQARIGPRRGAVELTGIFHVQRLVRPVMVEALDEVIELPLLLEEVLRRRLGGFLLEGQMHPFVAAVLLRVAGFDGLDADA